jgi:hypothetical protein
MTHAWDHGRMRFGSKPARHRRQRRLFAGGRHRVRYGPSRWMIPAGLAVVILLLVAAALLVTDLTTSAILLPPAR